MVGGGRRQCLAWRARVEVRLVQCDASSGEVRMALVAWFAYSLAIAATVTGEVIIYNCCPNGTYVTETQSCEPGAFPSWAPAVFSPSQGRLFDPGTVPDNWKFLEDKMPKCRPGEAPYFVPSEIDLENPPPPPFFLLENGSLALTVPHVESPPVDPGRYCVNVAGGFLCMPSESTDSPALPRMKKCCGRSAVFSEKSSSCKVHSQNLKIPNVTFVEGFPVCSETETLAISGKLDETHHLLPDGTLRFQDKVITEFCIEHIFEQPNDGVHVFTCPGTSPAPRNDVRFTIYPIGLLFSVFFLAVTLVASCLLPSTYHVLHWRCQTNHVACLLVGDLLLAVTQLSGDSLDGPACIAIGELLAYRLHHRYNYLKET